MSTTDRTLVPTRLELAKGQKPKVMVLGCSDSRVIPTLVFDKTSVVYRINPALKPLRDKVQGDELARPGVEANVNNVAKTIQARSNLPAHLVEEGELVLQVKGATAEAAFPDFIARKGRPVS